MNLSAGTDLVLDAVKARAAGTLSVSALGKVTLNASQNWSEATGSTVLQAGGAANYHAVYDQINNRKKEPRAITRPAPA